MYLSKGRFEASMLSSSVRTSRNRPLISAQSTFLYAHYAKRCTMVGSNYGRSFTLLFMKRRINIPDSYISWLRYLGSLSWFWNIPCDRFSFFRQRWMNLSLCTRFSRWIPSLSNNIAWKPISNILRRKLSISRSPSWQNIIKTIQLLCTINKIIIRVISIFLFFHMSRIKLNRS